MNSIGHLTISITKSVARLAACVLLYIASPVPILQLIAALFGAAELLGILEELVDKR